MVPDYSGTLHSEVSTLLKNASADTVAARSLQILVTSEELWDGAGVTTLAEALSQAGHNVTVAAPSELSSRASTTTAIAVGSELEPESDDGKTFSMSSPPPACVLVSVLKVDPRPDLVIAGIQTRSRTGVLLPFSGALGATLVAMGGGYPAMTVSTIDDSALSSIAEDVVALIAGLSQALPEVTEDSPEETAKLLPPLVGRVWTALQPLTQAVRHQSQRPQPH